MYYTGEINGLKIELRRPGSEKTGQFGNSGKHIQSLTSKLNIFASLFLCIEINSVKVLVVFQKAIK